jgi:nicotinamide-nucleotide adenylyltransferase
MKALFIGRFQPFHKGHLQVIQNASKKYEKIILGMGSSQYDNTDQNPFTADERKLMIQKSLKKIGIKNYEIVLIPDIHDLSKWASYVLSIIPNFDVILTNSPLTKSLFTEKGYIVKETSLYDRNKYSGKEIRKRIINDEYWENLVPESVSAIIKKIDGIKRLKEISKC